MSTRSKIEKTMPMHVHTMTVRKRDTGYLAYEIPIDAQDGVLANKTIQRIKDDPSFIFIMDEKTKNAYEYKFQ